ncbi:MAG: hypothetical protein ABJ063_13380 [Marinomonas sp.]
MTSKKITSNPNTARKRWLGSGSVLAAATALVAVTGASEAHAQQSMPGPRVYNSAPNVVAARRAVQRLAPREVAGEPVSVPPVRQSQPKAKPILPNARVNMVAPTQQQQVTVAPAPVAPAPNAPAANGLSVPVPQAQSQTQGTQQSGFSMQPLAAAVSGVAGINVSAEAAYDDTRIDFIAGVPVDTVNVLASSAIIDWTTFTAGAAGTEVSFLDAGRNLEFTSALADYTVLNRIFTPGFDSAIRIDGNVTSTVLGGAATGGNIWFYSPGGIVIGSTGSFNIGSLLLTTSAPDPLDVSTGNLDVSFLGTPNTDSIIRIEDGATITANNNNSYIAMVAPRIEQSGEVRANGSIAYVAAEQATLTIENGLFDISVDVGSGHSSGEGIFHSETGITTGPAQDSQFDEQGIYFVAVPKNNAIDMLVSGSVGYEAATTATQVDGKIILTTGNDVGITNNFVTPPGGGSSVPISSNTVSKVIDSSDGAGNITIAGATLTSETEMFAEGDLTLSSIVADQTDREIDLELRAGNDLTLDVTGGNALNVSGDLNIIARSDTNQGGNVTINVSGASAGGGGGGPVVIGPGVEGLVVGGDFTISTRARGLDDFFIRRNNGNTGIGQDAAAGDVAINISDGGNLQVGGFLSIDASAQGGKGEQQNGSADAGSFTLDLADGNLTVGGDLEIVTQGISAQSGKIGGNGPGLIGSDSVSGDVTINVLGGAVDIGGTLVARSDVAASSGTNENVEQSNDATAANFVLNVSGGQHNIGAIGVDMGGRSAESYLADGTSVPGAITRSTAVISVTGIDTGLNVAGDVSLDVGVSGAAPDVVGETVSVTVSDTGSNTGAGLTIGQDLILRADMFGGQAGTVNQGGSVNVTANNGIISANTLDISSAATALNGVGDQRGSDMTGGDVTLLATNGGDIDVAGSGLIRVDATGLTRNTTELGIGQAGTINLQADGSTISFADTLDMRARGFAQAGTNFNGEVGEGIGGTIRVTVEGAAGDLNFADLSASTDGSERVDEEGGFGIPGVSGTNNSGGTVEFNILEGTLDAADVTLSSGGLGGLGFGGGAGTGGDVTFNLDGGDAVVDSLTVSATGSGGRGGEGDDFFFGGSVDGGSGGEATGGTATFNGTSGSLTVTNVLTVSAEGDGGNGGDAFSTISGSGGAGAGGDAAFVLDGTATISASQIVVSTQATGGDGGSAFNGVVGVSNGGAGGNANGGTATFSDVAGNLSFNDLTVNSSGTGGDGGSSSDSGTGTGAGGVGGDGIGGDALVELNQDDAVGKSYNLIAQGIGGAGEEGITGGAGGLGQGGNAEIAVNDAAVVFTGLVVDVTASGGAASRSAPADISDGANGGNAVGGTATLSIDGANGNFQANGLIELRAGATGAAGSAGRSSNIDAEAGGNGGTGGNAAGGTAQFVISGGANVTIDADSTVLNADSTGGAGGAGGGNFGGGTAGVGGTGGNGTGGTVGIVATTGASVDVFSASVPFAMSSTGQGGVGGTGGGIDMLSGGGAGAGGNGGAGTGGSPTLSATGATISIGEVELFAEGLGGNGGTGGDDGLIVLGADGNGGNGTGGTPVIEAIEGSPGIITLGPVTITATGAGGTGAIIGLGDGGQVTIRDLSPDPAGLITFDTLTVNATGDPTSTAGNLTFESASGPITINGALNADVAGDIDFVLDGTGQVVVGGAANLDATNDITFTHSGNGAENISFDAGFTFDAAAGGDFIAGAGSIIDAERDVNIIAQNIDYDDIASVRAVSLNALTGSITGTATGTITARNINTAISLIAGQDVTFGDLITLDANPATRDGNITINASGDITGMNALTDQFITMDAAGLIDIENVQSVGGLSLVNIDGGSIDIETLDSDGNINLTTATGDLEVNDLDVRNGATLTSAAAIDIGTGDVASVTATAAGDLTAGTLTTTGITRLNSGGTATYTQINSSSQINIDAVVIEGGDIAKTGLGVIDLEAERINIGDIDLAGLGSISLLSNSDSVTAGNLNVETGSILVDSAADVVVGGANSSSTTRIISLGDMTVGDIDAGGSTVLTSSGDLDAGALISRASSPGLSVTVNGNADIESASANGLFTINVTGDLTGGSFTGAGPLSGVTMSAASVDITSVQSVGQSVTVTATDGDASVGTATSQRNTTITGDNVTLNSGTVGQTLTLNATDGSVNGTGTIDVAGRINLDATQDITFGSLTSGTTFDVDAGGDIAFTTALAGSVLTMDALGDITGGDAGNTDGTFSIFDSRLTAAGNLTLDSVVSPNDIDLDGINIDVGTLDAGRTIAVDATGTADVGNAISVGDTDITGATVNLDAGTIGGDLTATSTVGDIIGTGTITVAGSAFLDAARDIAIGTLDANAMTLFAARNVLFDGLISPNDIEIDATGGAIGATATGSGDITSTAGNVDLTSLTIAVGDVTADGDIDAVAGGGDASFGDLDSGGAIVIQALGNPSVASLTSVGDSTIIGAAITLSGGDVGGNLALGSLTGDVTLALDGADQILVIGVTNIQSLGGINVTHSNNTGGVLSLDSTGAIFMTAQGNVISTDGSIISSDAAVSIRTESALSIADVRGNGLIDLSAAGNATLNDATLIGGTTAVGAGSFVSGGIILTAGGDNGTSIEIFDPSAQALITGDVDSDGSILVEAGGNAVFQTGSNTVSENGLTVNTGDDIIVQTGALVEAASDPVAMPDTGTPFGATAGNLILSAGALGGQLFTTPLTPIASIVIEGTVEANDFAADLTANAIDGLGGTVSASSFSADINDAPNAGVTQIDDNGLLSANCLEGNICLGTINANNQILIGQSSNNDTIGLIIEQGTVNANRIAITTRNDIVMGTNGIATVLNAANSFSVQSDAGDVNLVDASITSGIIEIDAAGSLLGSATLTSANDIGISVGDSLQASAIITDGELTGTEEIGAPLEGAYSVAGDFDASTLSLGASDVVVSAGGDITIDEAISPDNVTLTADGDAFLGATNITGDVDVFAQNFGFGDLTAGGSIVLETNVGDIAADAGGTLNAGADIDLIAAGNADVGALNAGNSIGVDAGGNVSFTGMDAGVDVAVNAIGTVNGQDIDAGNDVSVQGDLISLADVTATGIASIDGASIAVSDVSADQINLVSGADILFDTLTSPNAIAVTAANGTIGANTGSGDIDSGAGVTLNAQEIAVGAIDAAGNVDASASAGGVSLGDVTSSGLGSSIALNAGGTAGTIETGALTTNDGDVLLSAGGDIALASVATSAGTPTAGSIGILTSGDVTATGTLTAGEDVLIRTLGDAALADVSAGDDVTIAADGSVTLGTATASGTGIDLFALVVDEVNVGQPGSITFGVETLAASNVTLSGQTIDAAEVLADANVTATTTAGQLEIDNAISGGTITLTGQGNILIDHAEADGDLIATGQANLTTGLNSMIVAGDIIINMPFGIVDLGNSSAGGLVDVTAEQIDFVTLSAGETVDLLTVDQTGGSVTVGNGNITGTDLTAGPGASSIVATFGNINIGGTALIGGSLDADASGDLFINLLTTQAGGYTGTAGGQIGFNGITSADFVDLDADSILGNGPIDAVGEVIMLGTTSVTVNGGITSGDAVSITSTDGPVDVDDVDADGDISVNGFGVTIGDVTSGGNVDVNGNTGNATMGTIDAAGSIDVVADGVATIAALNSGTNSTVTAGTVTVGSGVVGGDLTLNATADNLAVTGAFTVGGAIDLDAAGDISFGTLDAAGGAFTATAGGAIGYTEASASGLVDFDAQTTITGGDISSDTQVALDAVAGAITVADLAADGDVSVNGFGVTTGDVSSSGNVDVNGNTGNAAMGTIDAAGSIDVVADGVATIAALNSGTNSTVTAGTVTAGSGVVGGDLTLNATADDLTVTGAVTVGDAIDLDAAGDISFGTLDAAGGVFTATAGGAIDYTEASASGLVDFDAQTTITGGDISSDTQIALDAVTGAITVTDLAADGPIGANSGGDFTANDITQTDGNLDIDAGGNVAFNNASGASVATITTGAAGSVAGTTLSSTGSVSIGAGTGGVDLGTLTTGTANVEAAGGAIAIDDAVLTGLLTADGSDVNIQSSTDLTVDANAAAGGVQVIAQGDLDATANATGDIALVSLGNDAVINGASGQNVNLSAGGALDVVGGVDAAQALDVSSNGLFTLDALAIGETINVDAGDVDITVDGRLGDATITQSVTFTGFEEMLLGGAGGSGAPYEIDNAEFSRIHSGGDVTFQVFAQTTGGPALITVDTLDVAAGDGTGSFDQNIGQAAGLVLQSDQDIAVVGDLNIFNATLDTLLIAEAIELIRVNSETGGIFILDANDALAGVIEITARDFNAVTDSAFADIQGLSVADIDARLANSDGVDRPDGILRADTLDIDTTASQVFIQNTVAGTDFADRRGFDVNTLLISDSGGTVQPIVINGLIGGISGIDAIPLATIISTFDVASTINGCLIGNVASCSPIIINPVTPVNPVAPNDDSRDLIEEGLDPEDAEGTGAIDAGLLEYLPDAEFGAEPLIDEPVTGAGNEDLWVDPECPPGADPEICALEPAE